MDLGGSGVLLGASLGPIVSGVLGKSGESTHVSITLRKSVIFSLKGSLTTPFQPCAVPLRVHASGCLVP